MTATTATTSSFTMKATTENRTFTRNHAIRIAAMKEQLPAQLVVEATAQGPSVIRQDIAVPA